MSKKTQQDQPADDWAGLAQNLFGINLDKATGDEDLLDDDMFKVELPKPPEPPASIPQSEVEFAPAAESEQAPPAPSPVVAAKPVAKKPLQAAVKARASEDEPFGFGVAEEIEVSSDEQLALSSDDGSESEDAGLTLPEDFEADGLTLPADYDDGLTLPPEVAASGADSEESEDEDEDEDECDTEVLPAARGEADEAGRSEPRGRKQPRRTREDAYWDMLENWEWEEIPDHDSPRAEGDRPRSQRGDRGDRSGGRGGRSGGRGRDERPRSENRAPAGERPPRDDRRPAEATPTSGSDSGDRPRRPRSGDRPSSDRSPREDRPRSERRPERDEHRRDEPRQVAPSSQSAAPAVPAASGFDDFGSGIFEEQPQAAPPSSTRLSDVSPRRPREESVAQTSRAADAVLRDSSGSGNRPIEDELVWPDDDSDVRPAPSSSVVETSGLPPAEAAGESDEMVPASDVVALDQDDEALRPRRRRRRRGGPRSESSRTSPPPDGNEGTTFDLSDALASDSETPDFIPSAAADDPEMSEGASAEDTTEEGRSSEQRGRGRRRRRRRPGERPADEAVTSSDRGPSEEGTVTDVAEAADDDSFVLKPITYSNIPSWEEAIKYLLQPNLVGRNLGPDDADESLENDPRGSGGAEPTPPPPSPRRGGGGRGRGRR